VILAKIFEYFDGLNKTFTREFYNELYNFFLDVISKLFGRYAIANENNIINIIG
jgi:hypothetical protein